MEKKIVVTNCQVCNNRFDIANIPACCVCAGQIGKALRWFKEKYSSRAVIERIVICTDRANDIIYAGEYNNVSLRVNIEYTIPTSKYGEMKYSFTSYSETIPDVDHKRDMSFTCYPD